MEAQVPVRGGDRPADTAVARDGSADRQWQAEGAEAPGPGQPGTVQPANTIPTTQDEPTGRCAGTEPEVFNGQRGAPREARPRAAAAYGP